MDPGGTVQYSYDAFGRMVSQTRTVGSHSFTTGYGYDAAGNLRSITYPTGQTIQYLPDAIDPARTSAVRLNGTQTLATGLTHKPFGPVSGLTFGNGIALAIQYDKNYQMGAIAATGIMDRTYTPDNVGNIAQIIDNLDNSRSQSFGYDDHYRLTAAAGIYGSIGYTYDRVGNRLTHTDAAGTDAYDYLGGTNKLRTVCGPHAKSYSYDADGNTIAALGGQRPPLADQADYDYSSNGQRSKKVADSLTAISHYDQAGQLIAETSASGTLIKAYVWLHGQPLAQITATGAVYYYHSDHLGTPQRMTDSAGTVVWAADYLPFGQADVTVATVENNLRFAGQYFDSETGLHYNYHRYYDPGSGRYLRADPVGLKGGINPYCYARNNSINLFDPLGLLDTGGPSGAANTIECDGKGGIRTKVTDADECVKDCYISHEEIHKNDALKINPDICKGKADGASILWEDSEGNQSEINAHRVMIDCLKGKLECMKKDNPCRAKILVTIDVMERMLNSYK